MNEHLLGYLVDVARELHIRFKFERVWLKDHVVHIEHVLDSGKVCWTRAEIRGRRLKLNIPWVDDELNKFVHILEMCLDGTTYHGPYVWYGYNEQ